MAVPDPLFTAGCMQPSNELPNSICIVRLSAIGDVCHVVAVVQAIQKYYPNAAITWVIGRVEHALLGDLPGIEFIVFDKAKGLEPTMMSKNSSAQDRPLMYCSRCKPLCGLTFWADCLMRNEK